MNEEKQKTAGQRVDEAREALKPLIGALNSKIAELTQYTGPESISVRIDAYEIHTIGSRNPTHYVSAYVSANVNY